MVGNRRGSIRLTVRGAAQSEGDRYRGVHAVHHVLVKMSHAFLEPPLVKRAYLLEQDHRIA